MHDGIVPPSHVCCNSATNAHVQLHCLGAVHVLVQQGDNAIALACVQQHRPLVAVHVLVQQGDNAVVLVNVQRHLPAVTACGS